MSDQGPFVKLWIFPEMMTAQTSSSCGQDLADGALSSAAVTRPEFLGSEPKFAEPSARPKGAAQCAAAKLVSDPNNSLR